MLRLAENPPMKWPPKCTERAANRWVVAYCKPRQEKALAWDLMRLKIGYFLPMVLRETSSGGRRRRNLYPLFPSYMFFSGNEQERLRVLKTDRVVRMIDVADAEQFRLCDELTALETAIESSPESIELYPRIVPGALVRIATGPMKNMQGVVLQSHNKRRLWLGVSVLGVGATVEIHADLVAVD
jgi:transcription antitermination factor NusG